MLHLQKNCAIVTRTVTKLTATEGIKRSRRERNPHHGVVSLPHLVVGLAFKSLVSTDSTTRASSRNVPTRNDLRKFVAPRLYSKGIACRQKCRHFFLDFTPASSLSAPLRHAQRLRGQLLRSCAVRWRKSSSFLHQLPTSTLTPTLHPKGWRDGSSWAAGRWTPSTLSAMPSRSSPFA